MRSNDLPRRERTQNHDEVGQITDEADPGLHFLLQGESEFHRGDLGGAIQYFSIALNMLENISTSPPHAQWRVKALLRRAHCFFLLGVLDQSILDCTEALNVSKEMGFQEGIIGTIMLKTLTSEVIGDIRGAFQMAVFLKTLDLKNALPHVRRLRKNLERTFREDPTLAKELGDNLMSTGIEFFTNHHFKEAAEYFTEVSRLVCEFHFIREAYIYEAKCYFELGFYEKARDLCTTVLERFPDDEDGKLLLKSIDSIILEQKKGAEGAKKKKSNRPSSSRVPEKPFVPKKKPVPNKKQRQREEHRRMKETEEIGKEIRAKINKDRQQQEQKREKEKRELDGANPRPMPSYDVKAALDASKSRRETNDQQIIVQAASGPGARPKQRRPKETSGKTQHKKSGDKTELKDGACQKNGKASSRGSASLDGASEGRLPLPVKSADTERGLSNINQIVHSSTKPGHGRTPARSKNQTPKSVAKGTSTPDLPSPPGPSFAQDNGSLQGFTNSTATKRFSANRVELQQPKSEQKSREHLRSRFADNTDHVPRQSPNSLRHLESAGLDSFVSGAGSPRQDLFSTDQESIFRPEVTYTGLTEQRLPARSSLPSPNSSPETRTVDIGNTPKSQWESLVQISPLQIHRTLDLANKTKIGVLNTKSVQALDAGFSPQIELNLSWAPPPGVSTLCVHFLQDNRKGQPFRQPKPCSNCTKHSKLMYGIWRSDTKEWQVMRSYPKDVNPNVPFELCWYFSKGVTCQKCPCTFAHGEEELKFWTSERQSGRAPFGRIASHEGSPQENDFQDLPKPQGRVRGSLIIRDIRSNKPRPPPTGVYNGKFQLCKWWKSGRVCRHGTYCTFAHGENELKSWMGYQKEIEEAESEDKLSCQKPETRTDISRREMVYSLPGVEVTCNKPATVKIYLRGDEKRHIVHWEFTVKFEIREVGKLCEIDLLHRYHDCYRLKKIIGFLNNVEIFSEVPKERWSYNLPSDTWDDAKEGQMKVVVSVFFETTTNNQTFTQCLRFNFGKKPFLLQGLNVDIARKESLDTLWDIRQELKLNSSVWTERSMDIVPWPETAGMSSQNLLLLRQYKLPERIENVIPVQIIDGELEMTVHNYKRVMHQLLFTEELFMKKAISSFVLQNVQLDCQKSISDDWSGVVYAGGGEFFGIVRLQDRESLQPDDAASRLLIRNVNSAWIKIIGGSSQKVYQTLVQKFDNECVALKLFSQMCSDLNMTDGCQIFVDVQFQLNRKPLCDWHDAIDRLGPIQLSLLFPTPGALQITQEERRPWNWLPLDPRLNTNQAEVIKHILAPGDTPSPLVVFGPFGTGKTLTLNHAIRHLVTKQHNRILLCTHTNSAADIHVKLLHDYLKQDGLKATKPLRIYQTNRRIISDKEVARMYGLIENNAYVLPTRDDVIRHRVVITTLAMSRHLLELQLNHGFFTHILVDEAAQALEPEALIPLALAGPNTKVVFTGDHMQMGPEVYSHHARHWGLQSSLPERLFDHYCEKMPAVEHVMFLTENYRSHPDILQFPSDNFYGEGLIARSEQASHPRFGPLLFFSVHGVEEARENSYINAAEVEEIVKRVKLLADDWPVEWEEKDLSQIGVITAYMSQVRAIRTQLRGKGLQNVTVESIHNVQGKEFRAVFISTVRTSLTCHSFDRLQSESESLYWEFLSDPKLLNTAITRAMSLVAVVGDPISLCTAGHCRGNWRDYIKRCHERGTLNGASYEEIKKTMHGPLAKLALNPEANEFVPQSVDVSSKEPKSLELASQPEISNTQMSSSVENSYWEDDKRAESSASGIEDRRTILTEKKGSGIERDDAKEDVTPEEPTVEKKDEEEQEGTQFSSDSPRNDINSVSSEDQHQVDFDFQEDPQSRTQSQEEEDDDVKQSASDGFEEFLLESFEDETVLPRCFDNIIKAFVDKCKWTKEKDDHIYGSPENAAAFPSLHTAAKLSHKKSESGNLSDKQASQEKSSSFDHSSKDYEIRMVKGRSVVRFVNLGFHQTPAIEHQRLLTTSRRQDDFLDSQLLQQLLEEKPDKYVPCTLRLNSENTRSAYAEVSDTKTPDMKIKGRVRGAFDMDHVVVEKTDYQPSSCDGVPSCQGIIAGVLHHIISPRERHYVCKVDYENPGVMIPINKSVSKIVYLTDKKLKGLPLLNIYKEIHLGSETPFKVDEMDFTEALSGKFLFLVQYLQWRSDCHYPLGIVIRKLPQRETLSDSMRIVFAEHGVRDRFSKESKTELQTKFPQGWSIPAEEYEIRQKFERAYTIDPDNSKDLDDALTLEQRPDSVSRVGVHIADVSYFVEPGTQLDKEAMSSSTSYYPGHGHQCVPMLPRELSENHCSLLPGKDRLCVSVFLDVTEKGLLVGQPEIRRTIVRSCCRLTYLEAQKVIDGQDTSLLQIPQDVKGSIRILSALAQRRRKLRLRDASFDHWSNSDDGENFKAHELVDEMMLLANEEIAKFLSRSQKTSQRAPFRTQLPPKDHKLDDWVRQYGQFIKYSLFLRGFYSEETLREMANKASDSEASEGFKMQESVWSELCKAVEIGDQATIHKLICNESNHPQLAVANSQFRRIQPKSRYVCKRDQPEENVEHFALGMDCYTQFTSPIRRYLDIQVHRLVLDLIQPPSPNETISSKDQVAKVCRRSTFAQDNSRKFEKASSKVHLAAKLKEKSHETTAVIAFIDTDKEITLEILNREYNHLSTRQRKVKLSSLNPFDVQPAPDGLEITWRLRLYLAPEENIIEEPKKERKKIALLLSQGVMRNRNVLNLPTDNWLKILTAFQEGDYGKLKTMIRQTEGVPQLASRVPESNRPGKPHKSSEEGKADANLEHLYEKKLFLRKFDIANIQLTTHMAHGVFHPEIQLFRINPSVNICVEHRKYPRECFATTARYQASQKTYDSVDKYIDAWEPVLAMEAATTTIQESDEFTIEHLKITWKRNVSGSLEGSFSLPNEYCSSRQIKFHAGDFVCVLVREDSYMKKTDSENTFAPCEKTETEGGSNLLKEDQFSVTKSAAPSPIGGKPRHESGCASESFWVGHCIINQDYTKELSDKVALKVVTMDLHQSASDFPEELLNGADHLSALTVINRSLPHRRMFATLRSLPSASQLARSICMGHEPSQEEFGSLPSSHLSIVQEHPNCEFKPLNQYQEDAVKEALRKPFTLVQGPPGTGKTVTGVHIAYWFVKRNRQQRQDDLDIILPDSDDPPKGPPQVIYCGPSNKSVDVVAKYMLKIPGLKIIRVYGDRREQAEFPIPNKRQPLKQSTDDETQNLNQDNELKAVSLHHVIRRAPCPFAAGLEEYERKFDEDRKNDRRTSKEEVEEYCELIGKAECWALQESGVQVILCTCVASGKPRLTRSCGRIQQCIVDECGMCMELESLVPITCSKAQQVVLIGDHKQLQPIIQDNLAMTLGLSVSMFERLFSERAKMLELQYRMQEKICRFPSKYFYEEKLKTDPSVPTLDPRLTSFWPAWESGKNFPMAFCHVEGEEKSSSIKTAYSNEQSKANEKEVRKVVNVATSLVYKNNVDSSKVVILTPYREQRRKISDSLKKVPRCKDIPVTTIVKSQGSEWDYVILSLVRSLSKEEIDPEPSLYWLREHLGFLTDEHQINVGLTRARKGLCIIGNKNLLKVHPMWQELIEFYEESHCLVNESEWPRNLR